MLWLFFILLQQPPQAPKESNVDSASANEEIVFYGGRQAIFFAKEERVVLLDSAWVRYREMAVYADSINYNIKKHLLSAYGAVIFQSATEEVTGTELHYNVNTRKGMMRNARSQVENGYLSAKEAWLVKEKVINARWAHYTTCDLPSPHYTFFGPRVKLFMDDLAISEPVILRIWKIPILAAPFWLVPVASKRKSGLMPFRIGSASDQGYYAKGISYYWVINDYADATFFLDIMTRKGIQFRNEAVYIVEPYSKGSFQTSYIREIWNLAASGRPRYSFNLSSASKITPLTDLDIQAEVISDTAYAPEYAEDRLDWLKQEVYSYGALKHRFKKIGTITLRGERHIYYMRHYHYTQLPIISLNLATRTLPNGWDISPNLSFSRRLEQADSFGIDTLSTQRASPALSLTITTPENQFGRLAFGENVKFSDSRSRYRSNPPQHLQIISHELNLSTSQKLFGTFNTSEGISFSQKDTIKDTLPLRSQLSLSLNSSFSLFRVFDFSTPTIHGLLHTITPNIGFYYEPEIIPDGILSKPQLLKPVSAVLAFILNNSFQAKVGPGKNKVDLGSINFSTSFNPLTPKITPILADITARPLAIFPIIDTGKVRTRFDLWIDNNFSINLESLRFREDYSTITSFSFSHKRISFTQSEKGLELSLNHTWAKRQNMITGAITISFAYWRFTLSSIGYNFVQKQLTDYQVTIWRDLHCWEAIFNLSGFGKQWRYDFEVRIKKLPEVRFGKSTFRTFLP